MTHVHRVERLSKLGSDPLAALSQMTSDRWFEAEVWAVDGRVMWTIEDGIVTIHYDEMEDIPVGSPQSLD